MNKGCPPPKKRLYIHHVQGQQRAALAVYLQPFTAIAEQLISHLRNCDDAVRRGGAQICSHSRSCLPVPDPDVFLYWTCQF